MKSTSMIEDLFIPQVRHIRSHSPNRRTEQNLIRIYKPPNNEQIPPLQQPTNSPHVLKTNRTILSVKTRFPWNIFPCTVEIREYRININFKDFLSTRAYNIDLRDISSIFLGSSLFNATVRIVTRTFVQNDIVIRHLSPQDALHVKQTIDGLRIMIENNLDTSQQTLEELKKQILSIQSSTDSKSSTPTPQYNN